MVARERSGPWLAGAMGTGKVEALASWRDRTVVLVGFMGAGKTSVGRSLARRLGRAFVDADAVIEAEAGFAISDLFASHGEAYFRDLEVRTIARLVTDRPPTVLALGGGALGSSETAELIDRAAVVVHLEVDPSDIVAELPRLRTGRPMLAGRSAEEIVELYASRRAAYDRAHIVVPPDRTGPDRTVTAIVAALETAAGAGSSASGSGEYRLGNTSNEEA
jgi:shikimate kinase